VKKRSLLLAKVKPIVLNYQQLPLELGLEVCLYDRKMFRDTIQTQRKLLDKLKGPGHDLLYRILECNYLSFLHPSLYIRNLNRLRLIRYGVKWSSVVSGDYTSFLSYIILPRIHFSVRLFRVISKSEVMIPESFVYMRHRFNVKGLKEYLNLPSSYRLVGSHQLPGGNFGIEFATSRKGDCRIETYFVPESVAYKYHLESLERLCFVLEAVLLWKIEVDDFVYEVLLENGLVPCVFIDEDCLGCDYDFSRYNISFPSICRFFTLGCRYFPKELGFDYYIIKDYEEEADELNYLAMNKFDFNDFYQNVEFRSKICVKIKKELDKYGSSRGSERNISI